ncbi:Transcriptional regulator SlyA [uncultured archaeon]|nr:Transcriptional regulator SlyA [uncultured archaeon]
MENNKSEELVNDLFISANLIKSILFKIIKNNKELAPNHSSSHVLHMLYKNGIMTMTDIGEDLCISKPNLTVIIEQLVEKNLVKRIYEESDRRVIKIQITDKGKDLLIKTKKIIKEEFKKALSNLNQKDVEDFSKNLKNINAIITKIKLTK